MTYTVINNQNYLGDNFEKEILKISQNKLFILNNAIKENIFWNKNFSHNYINTTNDQRKIIEPELFDILSKKSKLFFRNLNNSLKLKTKEIFIFLPRLLITLPLKLVPGYLLDDKSLNKSGFLNPFINPEICFFSCFSDHPPHIDLIDFPELDSSKKVYTCLIPLNSSITETNGGLYLSKTPWEHYPNLANKRLINYSKDIWKFISLDKFQPVVWDQLQPHALGHNKTSKNIVFFRFCFCQDIDHIPNLRSPFISIKLKN